MTSLIDLSTSNKPTSRSYISIDGQPFYLAQPVQIDPASDFAQGIKTGPASNDQRLHAFFVSVNDYSGGIGYKAIDIREDVGVYHKSTLGVDSRRSNHIHGPPYIQILHSVQNSTLGTGWVINRNPTANYDSAIRFENRLCLAVPGAIFHTTDGITFTRVSLSNKNTTKIVNAFFGPSGTGYFVFQEGTSISADASATRSTNGTSWTDEDNFPFWDIWFSPTYAVFILLGNTNIDGSAATYPTADIAAGNLPVGQGQIFGEMVNPRGFMGVYFSKAGRLYNWYKDDAGVAHISESIVGLAST